MNDTQLLEKCPRCGAHLTLMESVQNENGRTYLVKRCLECHSFPVEEVVCVMPESEPVESDLALHALQEWSKTSIWDAAIMEDGELDRFETLDPELYLTISAALANYIHDHAPLIPDAYLSFKMGQFAASIKDKEDLQLYLEICRQIYLRDERWEKYQNHIQKFEQAGDTE